MMLMICFNFPVLKIFNVFAFVSFCAQVDPATGLPLASAGSTTPAKVKAEKKPRVKSSGPTRRKPSAKSVSIKCLFVTLAILIVLPSFHQSKAKKFTEGDRQ